MARLNYSDLADSLDSGTWAKQINNLSGNRTCEEVHTAALIDIMRSLRRIVRVIECPNTATIPRKLQALESLAREFLVPKKPANRKRKVVSRKEGA